MEKISRVNCSLSGLAWSLLKLENLEHNNNNKKSCLTRGGTYTSDGLNVHLHHDCVCQRCTTIGPGLDGWWASSSPSPCEHSKAIALEC